MDLGYIQLVLKVLKINKKTEKQNPLKFNKIRVLWSDYLHIWNPQTLCLKGVADFLLAV